MKMQPSDLRAELRDPRIKAVSVAFLELVSWRSRMIADLRHATGEKCLTIGDANVLLHVFVFGLVDGNGTRAGEIVDNLGVPRRTVRDSLAKWERLRLITQHGPAWYPTDVAAGIFNAQFSDRFRLISHVCGTFAEYRYAIGR